MAENLIEIITYQTEEGRVPFQEWIQDLRDREAAFRVRARIARLRAGNFGDAKAVGKGVSELRVQYGPGYRVYFARRGETVVALLCGGDKASQSRDVERAQMYWADFKRRMP